MVYLKTNENKISLMPSSSLQFLPSFLSLTCLLSATYNSVIMNQFLFLLQTSWIFVILIVWE